MQFESKEQLESWLVEVLSEETDLRLEDIDPKASFASLGIDSVESVSLACRLDEVFEDFTVKPDLFWEVDCISDLADELFARDQAGVAERVD
jgi:acyl carrier protein